jgi:hypothetical protein
VDAQRAPQLDRHHPLGALERARPEIPPRLVGARAREQVRGLLSERFIDVTSALEQHRRHERRHHQELVRVPDNRVGAVDAAEEVLLLR